MFLICCVSVCAQDLSSLRWKSRVLLLYTNDLAHPEYTKMEESLLSDKPGVKDRKLVIFTIHGKRFSRGLPAAQWQKGKFGFTNEENPVNGFGMKLVGLDGGVKFTSKKAISIAELWTVIDGMPMRRNELRKKGIP